MARLSVSEAIRQSGVSRSSFYAKFVNTGKISVSVDEHEKKFIDSSEVLRVFGTLKGKQSEDNPNTVNENSLGVTEDAKDAQIKLLQQQLAKSEERETFYQEQLVSLTNRLEGPTQQHKPNPFTRWWRGLDKK